MEGVKKYVFIAIVIAGTGAFIGVPSVKATESQNDPSVEHGNSGTQGKAVSDPDDDGRGPDRTNHGPDKPNGSGGVDKSDQDGNNGCGNDVDREDDNEGWCGHKPKSDHSTPPNGDDPKVIIVEKIIEKEIPIEKIIEKIVEKIIEKEKTVEVEKIIEKIKEIPIEKIVEKEVEKVVFVEKEVPVQTVVTQVVEKIVNQEVPVEKIVTRVVHEKDKDSHKHQDHKKSSDPSEKQSLPTTGFPAAGAGVLALGSAGLAWSRRYLF